MNISDALSFLSCRCMFVRIRNQSASAYVRGKWTVRVRAKGCETMEAMIVRLALKAQIHDQFRARPEPKPKLSRTTKEHLRRLRQPMPVN